MGSTAYSGRGRTVYVSDAMRTSGPRHLDWRGRLPASFGLGSPDLIPPLTETKEQ